MLSRQVSEKLAGHETPFYFYDMDLLRQTLDSVVWAASKYNFKIHYAIKANYDPRILEVIREYGLGIDCASGNEVRCAIEAGFDPKTIVYAGVGKKDKEIRYAIEQGIFAINCESLQELEVIDGIAASLPMVVVLPTPFTPTTITTRGFFERSKGSSAGAAPSTSRRMPISSRRNSTSSSYVRYLSLSTRASRLSTIFKVVSTPMSEATRASSMASRTESSILDLPAMVLDSLWKKPSFVFFMTLSNSPIVE